MDHGENKSESESFLHICESIKAEQGKTALNTHLFPTMYSIHIDYVKVEVQVEVFLHNGESGLASIRR